MSNSRTEPIADGASILSDMSMSFVNVEAPAAAPNQGNAPAISFGVVPKNDTVGQDSQISKTTACVTMKAMELPEDDTHRAPIDLIVVLDVSGSMRGSKLALCKTTLELLLRALYPEDRFGLICYSSTATVECLTQKMTEFNKKSCLQKIQSLRTRGTTNISSAIGLAYQEMNAIEDPNEVRSVFLLTDGHANGGIKDKDGLVELTRNCFAKGTVGTEQSGESQTMISKNNQEMEEEDSKPQAVIINRDRPITLHCFGYGSDHNSNLLEEMCGVTPGGSYYFVENDTNVGTAFGDALGGILSVVAQNVSVTIDVPADAKANGAAIVRVLNGRAAKRENGSYSISVGDFYAEETRDLLFEISLVTGVLLPPDPTPIPHAITTLSYIDTIRKIPITTDPATCCITRPIGSEVSASNKHVEAQLLRIEAVNAMDEADAMARHGNIRQAQERLRAQKRRMESSGQKNDMLNQLSVDFGALEEGFASMSAYEAKGRKYKSNLMASHGMQRCMESSERSSGNFYQNKRKKYMKAKMSFGGK